MNACTLMKRSGRERRPVPDTSEGREGMAKKFWTAREHRLRLKQSHNSRWLTI